MTYKILIGIVVFLILLLLLNAQLVLFWFSTRDSDKSVSLPRLIRLRLKRMPVNDIVKGYLLADKANLKITMEDIEQIAISGGNIQNIVLGLVAADQVGFNLSMSKAMEVDKQKLNVLSYVKEQIRPDVK